MKIKVLTTSLVCMLFSYGESNAGVPPACGGWPNKPAWAWTIEERLTHRSEVQCFEARRTEAGLQDRRDGSCRSWGEIRDFVFGTDTPELFFPWELLERLLGSAFISEADFRSGMRKEFARRADKLELPKDFWTVVETTAGDYITLLRDQRKLGEALNTASALERRLLIEKIKESQKPNCQIRAATLKRLNEAFPDQLFLKFLYTAVAPGLCVSGDGNTNHARIANGCLQEAE